MKDLHPSPSVGKSLKTESYRMQKAHEVWPEVHFVRCRFCGFICNLSRDSRGDGIGTEQHTTEIASSVSVGATTLTVDSTAGFDSSGSAQIYDDDPAKVEEFSYTALTSTTFTGVTGVVYAHTTDEAVTDYPDVNSGCPGCGSKNYT